MPLNEYLMQGNKFGYINEVITIIIDDNSQSSSPLIPEIINCKSRQRYNAEQLDTTILFNI